MPNSITRAGDLSISLLDSANAQVPGYSGIGGVLNVWKLNSTFTQSSGASVNLTFHFGGSSNGPIWGGLPLGASSLDLYYNNGTGGGWTEVASATDTTNLNIATTSGGQQTGYYALTAPNLTFWKPTGTAAWETPTNWDNGALATGTGVITSS